MEVAHVAFQKVQIVQGTEHITTYEDGKTLSGRIIYRLFCSRCGSCLFAKIGNGDITMVHPGNVKEDIDWGECLCSLGYPV